MPRQTFALVEGGEKRLELSWKGGWKDFTVKLDGRVIGVLPRDRSLRNGVGLTLPDGSLLEFEVKGNFLNSYLEVLQDGEPVPGSATSPYKAIRTASDFLYFLFVVNLVAGLAAEVFQVSFLIDLGVTYYSMIEAFIYLPLAYFTRQASAAALLIAIFIYTADAVGMIAIPVMKGYVPSCGGLVFRGVMLMLLIRGLGGISTVRKARKEHASNPAGQTFRQNL